MRRGPHLALQPRLVELAVEDHVVAAQVEFERHILKPGIHLIGARVETRCLSATNMYGLGGVKNVHRPTMCTAWNMKRESAFAMFITPFMRYMSAPLNEGQADHDHRIRHFEYFGGNLAVILYFHLHRRNVILGWFPARRNPPVPTLKRIRLLIHVWMESRSSGRFSTTLMEDTVWSCSCSLSAL